MGQGSDVGSCVPTLAEGVNRSKCTKPIAGVAIAGKSSYYWKTPRFNFQPKNQRWRKVFDLLSIASLCPFLECGWRIQCHRSTTPGFTDGSGLGRCPACGLGEVESQARIQGEAEGVHAATASGIERLLCGTDHVKRGC